MIMRRYKHLHIVHSRLISTGLNVNASRLKGPFSLQSLAARIGSGDVLLYPCVQLPLDLAGIGRPSDLIPLNNSQVMAQTRDQQHIRKSGTKPAVGRGQFVVIDFWLLGRISREEAGFDFLGFVYKQRYEAIFSEVSFLHIRDLYLQRLLIVADILPKLVNVQWEILHQPTGLRANDIDGPTVFCKAAGDIRRQSERCITP